MNRLLAYLKRKLLLPGGARAHRVGLQLMVVYLCLTWPLYLRLAMTWFGPALCYMPVSGAVVVAPTVGESLIRALDRSFGIILSLFFALLLNAPVWLLGYRSAQKHPWLGWLFYANGVACALYWGYMYFSLTPHTHWVLLISGITCSLFMYAIYEDNWMWAIWTVAISNCLGCALGHLVFRYVFPVTSERAAQEELCFASRNLAVLSHYLIDAVGGTGDAAAQLKRQSKLIAAAFDDRALEEQIYSAGGLAGAEVGSPAGGLATPAETQISVEATRDAFETVLDDKLTDTYWLLAQQRLRYQFVAFEYFQPNPQQEEKLHQHITLLMYQICHHLMALKDILLFKPPDDNFDAADETWLARSNSILSNYFSCSRVDLAAVASASYADLGLVNSPSVADILGNYDQSVLKRRPRQPPKQVTIETPLAATEDSSVYSPVGSVEEAASPLMVATPAAPEVDTAAITDDLTKWRRHLDLVEELKLTELGIYVSRTELAVTKLLLEVSHLFVEGPDLQVAESILGSLKDAQKALSERYNSEELWLPRLINALVAREQTEYGEAREDVLRALDSRTGVPFDEFIELPATVRAYVWQRSAETHDRICAMVTLLNVLCSTVNELYVNTAAWHRFLHPSPKAAARCC